jgi:prepilin-type N-terminal cleavage/methylation domain-containing protein
MKPAHLRRNGFTLTEMIVYVAILSIAVAMFSKFMTGFIKTAKTSESGMLGSAELRLALARMEGDLYEANEFSGVSRTSVTFVCDMLKNPGWDPDADADGDGVPNIKDTDADGDAQQKFSLPRDGQWRAGYNLEDDDEDNDGRRDVRVQVYYSSGAVYRALSVNEGAWQVSRLAASVSSFTFTFYGSKREDLGKNIDLGADGAASTGDAGEADGMISEREMDWVLPPAGHGNRSGGLDTADERKYITSAAVYMETDANHDGHVDAHLGTEILPPLLPLKRKR